MHISSKIAIGASAGMVLSFLLPWVQLLGFSASGYNLSQFGSYGNLAWLVPLIGLVTLAVSASQQIDSQVKARVRLLSGMFVGIGMAYLISLAAREQAGGAFIHTVGVGVYLGLACAIALTINAYFIPTCTDSSKTAVLSVHTTALTPTHIALRDVKEMFDAKLISDAEYEAKRKEILARI